MRRRSIVTRSKKGITLIELMTTLSMIVILAGFSVYVYYTVYLGWQGQEIRAELSSSLNRAVDEMVRDLREATEVMAVTGGIISFTAYSDGKAYAYYLYNASDPPPFAYNQAGYELKRVEQAAGGGFTFGGGKLVARNVLPPPATDLSFSGNIATLDISVSRDGETVRAKTKVRPRDLETVIY